jgi:hypothetical protein
VQGATVCGASPWVHGERVRWAELTDGGDEWWGHRVRSGSDEQRQQSVVLIDMKFAARKRGARDDFGCVGKWARQRCLL